MELPGRRWCYTAPALKNRNRPIHSPGPRISPACTGRMQAPQPTLPTCDSVDCLPAIGQPTRAKNGRGPHPLHPGWPAQPQKSISTTPSFG